MYDQWHLDPNKVSPTATMQAAGGSYRWLRDVVCELDKAEGERRGVSPYKLMDAKAERVGSGKIIFLPYLMGERAPWWNPNARGVFFGLALGHRQANLIRAVLEGVCFNLKLILDVFEEMGASIESIRVIGVGARSKLWRQIMANIYGKEILGPEYLEEATSLGAAIAGAIGAGVFKDFSVAEDIVKIVDTVRPDYKTYERYKKLYRLFKELYHTLAPLFD